MSNQKITLAQTRSKKNVSDVARHKGSGSSDLSKRVWFTLIVLLVYRLGAYIPLPNIDPVVMSSFFSNQQSGLLGMFNIFSGGAVSRMAIFSLSIMPYISASIIVQLFSSLVPQLSSLKKEGSQGTRKLNQYTRYLTLILALIQGYGVALKLEAIPNLVITPGVFFYITTIITLVGGTLFLMWLGEQITSRGIGNGTSLIIFAGIVAQLPSSFASILELGRQGAIPSFVLIGIFVMIVVIVFFVVFMERAQRRLVIQYPKRQVGNMMYASDKSHLPLKLNTSGVIPPIFASSLLLIPVTVIGFFSNHHDSWLDHITFFLGRGHALYMILYVVGIIFFSFFYTAVVFEPADVAENLKKNGGFILGIRPGKMTADYFDYVLTRLTVIGALYLALVCFLPELIISYYSLPLAFGGTSILIVVSVIMDTFAQIQSYLLSQKYEGLIRRSRLK